MRTYTPQPHENLFKIYLFIYFVSPQNQPSPRLPKSGGFSRISIKRVSGVISSSFKLPSSAPNEPNAVFYTGM